MIERREFRLVTLRGRYGFAVLAVAVAALLMIAWLQVFEEPAIAPFLAAILLSGWYAGVGPVIVTAIVSVVVYLALFPDHAFELSWAFAARMGWFLAFGWLAGSFGAGRKRAAERLMQARTELEERVVARTAALQRSEEYLVAAQRLSHTGSWTWRIAENEVTWSEECARILGFPRGVSTIQRSQIGQLPHPADRERVVETQAAALREKRGYELRMRVVRPDGAVRFVRAIGRPVLGDTGEVVEFVGILMDLTARRRASRRLRRAREEAARERFRAVLDERTRLARELHDTLLQGFTGIGLNLLAVTNRVTGPPEVVAALRGVVETTQATLENARRAIWDIRPDLQVGSDLPTALRAAVAEGIRGTALRHEVVVEGEPRVAVPEVETVLLRIAQEAIANVVTHAAANTLRVTLTYGPRELRLSVRDDGRGFHLDPDLRAYRGHLGLLGMRERAAQVHGTLAIHTAFGEGTEIVFVRSDR